jgi:hypothetical protein
LSFAPGRGWTTEVVGESKYQDNLRALYKSLGGTEHDIKATATLVPEEGNQFDTNAVKVEINRRTVGYLTKQMAIEYRAAVGTTSGQCGVKIVGGFLLGDGTRASFGAKLNISWPPRLKS